MGLLTFISDCFTAIIFYCDSARVTTSPIIPTCLIILIGPTFLIILIGPCFVFSVCLKEFSVDWTLHSDSKKSQVVGFCCLIFPLLPLHSKLVWRWDQMSISLRICILFRKSFYLQILFYSVVFSFMLTCCGFCKVIIYGDVYGLTSVIWLFICGVSRSISIVIQIHNLSKNCLFFNKSIQVSLTLQLTVWLLFWTSIGLTKDTFFFIS